MGIRVGVKMGNLLGGQVTENPNRHGPAIGTDTCVGNHVERVVVAEQIDDGNQGRIEEAKAEYEMALEIEPKNSEVGLVYNNLGAIALEQGDLPLAQEHFEKAVGAAPRSLESRYNLALIYLDSQRVEEAIEMLETAANVDPNHEVVNVRLAYLQAGRGEDAFRTFTLVSRLFPNNWMAPLGLAVLHAANGRPEQAKPLLERALQMGGDAARQTASGYQALAGLL